MKIYKYRRKRRKMSEEEKNGLDVALEIKLEVLKKVAQISLLIELYCDDKKVLKCLKKIVCLEEKKFKQSRFSKTETTFSEIAKFLDETQVVIKALLSASTTEAFNRAKKAMEEHIASLQEALKPQSEVVQGVKNVIEKAKSKVKSFKSVALEKLEKLKNNVCDTKDDDSESV